MILFFLRSIFFERSSYCFVCQGLPKNAPYKVEFSQSIDNNEFAGIK